MIKPAAAAAAVYLEVGAERVLVHGVDVSHLGEDEEENGAALGDRPVDVAVLLDLVGSLRCQLQLLRNFARLHQSQLSTTCVHLWTQHNTGHLGDVLSSQSLARWY